MEAHPMTAKELKAIVDTLVPVLHAQIGVCGGVIVMVGAPTAAPQAMDDKVKEALDRLLALTIEEFEACLRQAAQEAKQWSDEFDRKRAIDPLYLFRRITI